MVFYFKPQNTRLYLKFEIDCIYIIFYEQNNIRCVSKIRDNFINNSILYIIDYDIDEFFKNNSEDKVSELFDKKDEYNIEELEVDELVIYEMFEK